MRPNIFIDLKVQLGGSIYVLDKEKLPIHA